MNLQLEARDIIEMISRYVASNKNEVCFVGSFFALDDKEKIKEGSDLLLAFGNRDTLRMMLNGLRDVIEDHADEDGFVNI